MKSYIIYNSKTGFTKRYAEWIAEELNYAVIPYKDLPKAAIDKNGLVIFGSRIHAGRIEGLGKIKSRFGGQKLIVFAVGVMPAAVENEVEKIWVNNFTESERKTIPHFYFQGGLNYEAMGFVDRTLMKTVAKMLEKKKDKTAEEEGFLNSLQGSYDAAKQEYIMPLVECARGKLS